MKAKLKTYLDAKFASLADQIDYSLRSAKRKDAGPRMVPELPPDLPDQESLPQAQFEAWTRSVDNWLLALTDRLLAVEEQLTGMNASIAELRDCVTSLKTRLDLNDQKLRAVDAHVQTLLKRAETAENAVVVTGEPTLLAGLERAAD
jgi:uncharacterized coiled-coil protein SlyX